MKLRYHSDSSSFYDEKGDLYSEPSEALEVLETKLAEACQRLESLPPSKPASEYSEEDDDDLFFDLGIARFNLCNFIEDLEWKIDLKLFYAKKCSSN